MIIIWLALMGVYYFCVIGMRLALKLPAVIAFVVCLPALPFIVAYRNRKEHPTQAKAIYLLWGLLSVILLIFCFIG